MIWKDRIKQYPHRYTLTNVSGSTYDFAEVTGEVTEAGTPINAENLNKLIQRDGDDIKDTITTFSEAATEANILSTESTSTLFGKIKKWYTNKIGTLKSFAYNPATYITSTDTDGTIINNSDNQDIYGNKKFVDTLFADKLRGKNLFDINGDYVKGLVNYEIINDTLKLTALDTYNIYCRQKLYLEAGTYTMSCISNNTGNGNNAILIIDDANSGTIASGSTPANSPNIDKNISVTFNISVAKLVRVEFWISITGSLTLSGDICTFKNIQLELGATATPYTPYIGEFFPTYDKVIRTQAEFEALIASPAWFDAVSVAFVGQFTLSTPNNSGVKIPATVKQIHGFNSAKITITNFIYDESTAKGGLWYDTAPTTQDYSIRDLEVSCTGTVARGFFNCNNLSNCTGTGTGTVGNGYGFSHCNNLSNCTGTGTGTLARGFFYCNNLSNCTGTGTGTTYGYGFSSIDYAVNCKDGGSSTDMWGGTNKNISVETCRKTAVTADNATLNT